LHGVVRLLLQFRSRLFPNLGHGGKKMRKNPPKTPQNTQMSEENRNE